MIPQANNGKESSKSPADIFAAANEIQAGQPIPPMRRSIGPGDLNGQSPRQYIISQRIQTAKPKPQP